MNKKNIAIIGSGIAGLSSAYLLSNYHNMIHHINIKLILVKNLDCVTLMYNIASEKEETRPLM